MKAKFDNFFPTFTKVLSDTGYAARTNGATIADVFAFNEVASTAIINMDLSQFPAIHRWFNEIAVVPAVQECSLMGQEMFMKYSTQAK
jgi:glutathione S-transferase